MNKKKEIAQSLLLFISPAKRLSYFFLLISLFISTYNMRIKPTIKKKKRITKIQILSQTA
jgi:hypothetical protein